MTDSTDALIEAVKQGVREAFAKRAEREDAPHKAKLIRSGKWDDVVEMVDGFAGALAALRAIEAAGFVVVPVDATEEMNHAGLCWARHAGLTWSAMLAARPKIGE